MFKRNLFDVDSPCSQGFVRISDTHRSTLSAQLILLRQLNARFLVFSYVCHAESVCRTLNSKIENFTCNILLRHHCGSLVHICSLHGMPSMPDRNLFRLVIGKQLHFTISRCKINDSVRASKCCRASSSFILLRAHHWRVHWGSFLQFNKNVWPWNLHNFVSDGAKFWANEGTWSWGKKLWQRGWHSFRYVWDRVTDPLSLFLFCCCQRIHCFSH